MGFICLGVMSTKYLKLSPLNLPFYDAFTGLKIGVGEVIEISMSITSYNIEKALLTGQLVYADGPDYQKYLGGFNTNSSNPPLTNSPVNKLKNFSKAFSKAFN